MCVDAYVYGCVLCVDLCERVCMRVGVYEYVWIFLDVHGCGFVGMCMDVYGCVWMWVHVYGFVWMCKDVDLCGCNSMYEFVLICMGMSA